MSLFDPQRHHRRSIRLKGYDYTQPGAYFVTICTQDRLCLFGEVVDGVMRLNDAGHVVQAIWDRLPDHYAHVTLDAFVIMPNHVHGIVLLMDAAAASNVRAANADAADADAANADAANADTANADAANADAGVAVRADFVRAGFVRAGFKPAPTAPTAPTTTATRHGLPEIIRAFKTFSARRINAKHGTPGRRVWQRNYYEHIIRNDAALNRIRRYIIENPARWSEDRDNPDRPSRKKP